MPIYAYRCAKCGSEEEHIQKFSDPPMTECGSCGGSLEKMVSPSAFHLKGGGWYKDGYASTKSGGGSDSGSSSSGSDSSSSSSSSNSSSKSSAAAE